jgi:formylglycine-generating enzyme required for sulfatase activity
MSAWFSGAVPLVLASALTLNACGPRAAASEQAQSQAQRPALTRECAAPWPRGEVRIDGGTFLLGANPESPEEGPSVSVTVKPFFIDRAEVTNADFAEFVAKTGYVTLAERAPDPALYPDVPRDQLKPSAIVFVQPDAQSRESNGWRLIEGANWRRPEGPASSLAGRERNPVVEIGYEDALAYARWRGRDLPTEAEWEFAARAGREGARFEWGETTNGPPQANTWQGLFPAVDGGDDGYKARTAPVGCFAASAYGLFDMTGNVWEWTKDVYAPSRAEPGPPQHLIKGGSFLCADNFCMRYRPSARQGGPPDTGSSHIGFRTVRRT